MKRMYSRQLVLTVSMVLLALVLVSVFFQAILFNYVTDRTKDDLQMTADAVAEISELCTADGSTVTLPVQASFAARATGQDILITDDSGRVTTCSCGIQHCEHLDAVISPELLNEGGGKLAERLKEIYGERRMVSVSAATDGNGRVLASAGYVQVENIMKNTVRINLLTILIVFPICVLAVWLLIRRQTQPLRRLTDAAKQLGRGDLSVRVPVNQDEIAETAELAVAFNNMAQSLEKSDTRRKEFIANVSHELKTPMTTISGYMDGMLDGTIPAELQPRYMLTISNEVKRLSRLVRNMLDISRMQDKGIPSEKKRNFDICGTVGETLINFEQRINGKRLQVEAELPPEGVTVYGDPDSIAQVIYNLTDNAIKFCSEEGTLSLRVEETTGGRILVAVTNDGPDIPAEELPFLFDRFHKADKSRSDDRDGWGLGLYIAKTIVRAHGEDIFVTSKDGKTTFSFTIRKSVV